MGLGRSMYRCMGRWQAEIWWCPYTDGRRSFSPLLRKFLKFGLTLNYVHLGSLNIALLSVPVISQYVRYIGCMITARVSPSSVQITTNGSGVNFPLFHHRSLQPSLTVIVSQKTVPLTFIHNFDKRWPIFRILLLLYSPRNLQQNLCHIAHIAKLEI